jgi:hypothetical protein
MLARMPMAVIGFFFLLADGRAQNSIDPPLTAADRSHWSFSKPVRPSIPKLADHPVDAFLLSRLQEKKLSFSPEADRRTLIHRLTLDLHGLPPSRDEINHFLNDQHPNAYERLVDRLLSSPHYGERQAQHWLDIVRYAESNGYELDGDRPNAWRYRDYIVQSFNSDKPYVQFIREQLAGDLTGDSPIATGFLRCGPVHVVSGNLDVAMVRQEVLTEMVTGVGSAILGLTIGCARCHDHKFDPISQGDYYRLEAYFAGTRFKDIELASENDRKSWKAKVAEIKKKTEPIRRKIAEIDDPIRSKIKDEKVATLDNATKAALDAPKDKRTSEQRKLIKNAEGVLTVRWDEILERLTPEQKATRDRLRADLFAIEGALPPPLPEAWAVSEDDEPPSTFVLKRGDIKRKTERVAPQPIRVVSGHSKYGTSRLDLANWITATDHPLTARVIVNRIWQQHFGQGLVDTPNDFGTRGGKPSHPALLDWLACELGRSGELGGFKAIHRLIVTSRAYRQGVDKPLEADPDNRLLSRMNRIRLDAETIRDRMLAVSGSLNRQIGGPSVRIPLEPEVYDLIFTEDEPDQLWRVTADARQHDRRSIYLYAKRNVRYPMLEAFDQPDGINSCAIRGRSTFAPQALILMNGPFVQAQAQRLSRLHPQAARDQNVRNDLFESVIGRQPTPREVDLLRKHAENGHTEDLSLGLLNLSEFITRP